MTDQVVDATMAAALQADAIREHSLVAWVVTEGAPDFPGRVIARLVSKMPSDYVLVADSLPELRNQLPPGLTRSARRPADPPKMLEFWLA